jgi:uroporphyrinogen decarboxylase
MSGRAIVGGVLESRSSGRLPVLPILHTALARMQGVPLGQYFTDAAVMAAVIVRGCREFGLDGVQMTMGVAGEAEALGAGVEQPADGAPLVKTHPLQGPADLGLLRKLDPAAAGRMPLYHEAVARAVRELREDAFVLSTLRGPLNIASQLCGVEQVLMNMIDTPAFVEDILDFTTDVAVRCSRASLETGAHGLAFGEATCSPNFISPAMYRRFVQPRHRRLIGELRAMGWRHVGLHVCGNILPIMDDLIATGASFLDVDYQVPATKALERAGDRVALRGNLDPVALFFKSDPGRVRSQTLDLVEQVRHRGWILGSGCDIPPGTPAANVRAFVAAAREACG